MQGTGPGQFNGPSGIAVDSNGNVYVVDTFNARIQKFDSYGAYVLDWPTSMLSESVDVDMRWGDATRRIRPLWFFSLF